MKKTRVLG